jgi:RNA polymerase sigma factor (sigma-70 family)
MWKKESKNSRHLGFRALMDQIDRFPEPLAPEEEKVADAMLLFTSNKRYAFRLAEGYFRKGDDDWNERALVSAITGLYIATRTYDPSKEGAVHFKSYAHSRILWEISDELKLRSQHKASAKGKALHVPYSETDKKNFKAGAFHMQPEPTDKDTLKGYLNDALRHVSRKDDLFIVKSFFAWGENKKTLKELGKLFGVGISEVVRRRGRGLTEMREYLVDRFGGEENATKAEATENARSYLFGMLGL